MSRNRVNWKRIYRSTLWHEAVFLQVLRKEQCNVIGERYVDILGWEAVMLADCFPVSILQAIGVLRLERWPIRNANNKFIGSQSCPHSLFFALGALPATERRLDRPLCI